MKTLTLIAASAAVLIGAGAATAQDPQVEITFSKSDLFSESGQARLHAQIQTAAREACVVTDMRDLHLRGQRRACIESAVARAEAALQQKVAEAGARYYAQVDDRSSTG